MISWYGLAGSKQKRERIPVGKLFGLPEGEAKPFALRSARVAAGGETTIPVCPEAYYDIP